MKTEWIKYDDRKGDFVGIYKDCAKIKIDIFHCYTNREWIYQGKDIRSTSFEPDYILINLPECPISLSNEVEAYKAEKNKKLVDEKVKKINKLKQEIDKLTNEIGNTEYIYNPFTLLKKTPFLDEVIKEDRKEHDNG